MREKILTVLVVASLILSVFNLVLLLRTNGTNTVTNMLGQSSSVTWKKIQYNDDDWSIIYSDGGNGIAGGIRFSILDYPLWNVTMTTQWKNGTTQVYDLGESMLSSEGNVVSIPQGLRDFSYVTYGSTWNITSITAYAIQPPLS
jgi:hypothetical protein